MVSFLPSLALTQSSVLGGNHSSPGCLDHQSYDTVLWLLLSSLPFPLSPLTVPHDLMLLLAAYSPFVKVLIMQTRGLPKGLPYL